MSRTRDCRELHQRLAAQLNDSELLDHESAWQRWNYHTSRPIGEPETDKHKFARMIWFVYHAERLERDATNEEYGRCSHCAENDLYNCHHDKET